MTKCKSCKKKLSCSDTIIGKCASCSKHFCSKHRVPFIKPTSDFGHTCSKYKQKADQELNQINKGGGAFQKISVI